MDSRDELFALLGTLLDGSPTPAQVERLKELLAESPEARRLYLNGIEAHVALEEDLAFTSQNLVSLLEGPLPMVGQPSVRDSGELQGRSGGAAAHSLLPTRRRTRAWTLAGALATVAVVAVVAIRWTGPDPPESDERVPAPVVARLLEIEGRVEVVRPGTDAIAAGPRTEILVGDRIRTFEEARVTIRYEDGSRLEVHDETEVVLEHDGKAKQVVLLGGGLRAVVSPQDRPMRVVNGDAVLNVLGTTFRAYREKDHSRVELEEGRVQVRRTDGSESVTLESGEFAEVSSAVPLKAERLPRTFSDPEYALQTNRLAQFVNASPDGRLLLATSRSGRFTSWSTADWATEPVLNEESATRRAVFEGAAARSDGTSVAVDDRGVLHRWQAATAERLESKRFLQTHPRYVAVSPDGTLVATYGIGHHARVWNADTGELVASFGGLNNVRTLLISHDGRLLVVGRWGRVRVYDIKAGERVGEFRRPGHVARMALTRDNALLATFGMGASRGVEIVRFPDGEPVADWLGAALRVRQLEFSPDGSLLVAVVEDGTIRVRRLADGAECLLSRPDGRMLQAAFTPEGRRLLTTGTPREICVWNLDDVLTAEFAHAANGRTR